MFSVKHGFGYEEDLTPQKYLSPMMKILQPLPSLASVLDRQFHVNLTQVSDRQTDTQNVREHIFVFFLRPASFENYQMMLLDSSAKILQRQASSFPTPSKVLSTRFQQASSVQVRPLITMQREENERSQGPLTAGADLRTFCPSDVPSSTSCENQVLILYIVICM